MKPTCACPLGDYERLMGALPSLQIDDATGLVRALRMVKSEAEIKKLSHICAIGSRTFDAVPKIAHEGMPFEDLFRQFRREALSQGADDVPIWSAAQIRGLSRRDLAALTPPLAARGRLHAGHRCDLGRVLL